MKRIKKMLLLILVVTQVVVIANETDKEYFLTLLNKDNNKNILSNDNSQNYNADKKKKGRIVGIIVDKLSGEPLPGANIMIKGTSLGTASDYKGEFSLPKLPLGDYTIVIKYVGYKTKEEKVSIKTHSVFVKIKLDLKIIEGNVVEVTAQAKGQMEAINQQLSSNTIKNVVSSDRINEIPDANAAESVGRLPGVSIVRSGGEATDVIIRGLSKGFTTVSIDGVKMTSTDESRGVGIANITPEMLDGIELTKAITPDMDGDATAGAINFKLKEAAKKGLSVGALVQGGYSGYDGSIGMPKVSLNFSNRFFDDKLGVFSQVSFFRANRGTDNFSAIYQTRTRPTEENPYPDVLVTGVNLGKNFELRDRYGFSLVADYEIPNGRLFFKNFSSKMSSESIYMANEYLIKQKAMLPNATGSEDIAEDAVSTTFSGKHNIFGGLLDWSVSHSYRLSSKPNIWKFSPELTGSNLSHEVLLGDNRLKPPETIPSFLENLDTDRLTLRYTRHYTKRTKANEYSARINMKIPFTISNTISANIKFGGKYSRYNRSRFDTEKIVHLRTPSAREAELKADFPYLQWTRSSGADLITMTGFVDPNFNDTGFLDGDYKLYFPLDIELSKRFMKDIQKYAVEDLRGRKNNYDNIEQYYAAYVMSEINITKRLKIIPGVRFEKTSHAYDAFFVQADKEPSPFVPLDEQGGFEKISSYETRKNWLPMFHIKYDPLDWLSVRFAITNTLKRPFYQHFSPSITINSYEKKAIFGNPKLKVQEAINYDLHTSFFSNYIGLLTVGGFYKSINNLIYAKKFTTLSIEESKSYDPSITSIIDIATYENVPGYNTWTGGLEIDWQTRFWYLPFPFNGLVLNINYAYIQSETILPSFQRSKVPGVFPPKYINKYVEKKSKIPGQNDHLGNISLGYDIADFSIRVTALYQGPTYGYESYIVNNDVTEELFRWDIKATEEIFKGLKIMLDFSNITNWPDKIVNEYTGYTRRRVQYGWQGFLGLRYQM